MHSRFVLLIVLILGLHVAAQPASAQIHYGAGYHKVPPGGNFYNGLRGGYNYYSGLSSTTYRYGTKYYYPSTTDTYRKHITPSIPTTLDIPRYTGLTPTRIYANPYYKSYKQSYPSYYRYRGVYYSATPTVLPSPHYPKR